MQGFLLASHNNPTIDVNDITLTIWMQKLGDQWSHHHHGQSLSLWAFTFLSPITVLKYSQPTTHLKVLLNEIPSFAQALHYGFVSQDVLLAQMLSSLPGLEHQAVHRVEVCQEVSHALLEGEANSWVPSSWVIIFILEHFLLNNQTHKMAVTSFK